MPVVAYADVGKAVADLFKGSAKSGAFNLDNKVTYQGATSSGLNVTLTAVTKGDKVEPTLKAAYGKGNYSADISVDGSGSKAALNFGVANVLPGLKLTGSVALPDPNSGKASVEYTGLAQLSTKATVTLTSSPVVEVVASTGFKDVILGVEAGYDTAKSAVNKYNFAIGYHQPDFQLAVNVLDQLSSVKVGFAQNVSSTTKVGAEVTRKLSSGDTSINLGYSKSLASGALAKFKIDNTGLLTALYETKLASGEKVAGAFQVQATNLSAPLKYGFALDLA